MQTTGKTNGSKSRKSVEYASTKFLSRLLLTSCAGLLILLLILHLAFRANSKMNVNSPPDEEAHNTPLTFQLSVESSEDVSDFSTKQFWLTDGSEHREGCYQQSCGINCFRSENLYEETAAAMTSMNCEVFTALVIANQTSQYIDNNWIDVNRTVMRIAVVNSRLEKIKSGAFNSPIFARVMDMAWLDLQVDIVSTGALLGLYGLRRFEVDFKAPSLGMSLLQPVQTTLTHLRLNCGIPFLSNSNIFGNIYMDKLLNLDLSGNQFSGPLSRQIFSATPSIKYVYLRNCQITAIEELAFADVAHNLVLVDLKHNQLTHINADLLGLGANLVVFDVEPNDWHCNCQLRSLFDFYKQKRGLFVSPPYCRRPLKLYGKSFDELSVQELQCGQEDDQKNDSNDKPAMEPTMPYGPILQFQCTQAIAINNQEQSRHARDLSGNFVFEPPAYDLELKIMENNSVRAYIDAYQRSDNLNIIWFTEDSIRFEDAPKKDYNCMLYEEPFLMTEPLLQNHTYTFCMMSVEAVVISPLFCQPLHIPLARTHKDELANGSTESDKQFTIAMLCLIFFISIIFGAIFAYLGIKSFPNLLEGSKNVVVIKESDKRCCVSTIGESQYGKSSLKKSSLHRTDDGSSHVFPAPVDFKLPNSSSYGSSSTCCEENFADLESQGIAYELPMPFLEGRKMSSIMDRPDSPPPLPKRNSRVSLQLDQRAVSCEKLAKQT